MNSVCSLLDIFSYFPCTVNDFKKYIICVTLCASDAGASAWEREDMELLEQALKKALKVRAGNGPPKKDSKTPSLTQKETSDAAAVVCKEGTLESAPSKRKQSSRSALKSASTNRKEHTNSGTVWSLMGL